MTKQNGHFLFLGTGGSMGIPVIGCHCAVCESDSPCNQRLRPSAVITIGEKRFLIDCGPDFREQALKHHIDNIDGIILTHAHHDHIAGIDELRVYFMRKKAPIPCLLSDITAEELLTRYRYIFDDMTFSKLTPRLGLQKITEDFGQTVFEEIPIGFVSYEQAGMKVTGYRFGNLAYISDIKNFSESIFTHLQGVETLILSALRFTPSPFHITIDEAIAFATRVRAKHTWITHISHDLDHEATNSYLPSNVRMAYDGLELNFTINP